MAEDRKTPEIRATMTKWVWRGYDTPNPVINQKSNLVATVVTLPAPTWMP
jgi:hypothetical protein